MVTSEPKLEFHFELTIKVDSVTVWFVSLFERLEKLLICQRKFENFSILIVYWDIVWEEKLPVIEVEPNVDLDLRKHLNQSCALFQ